jgi:hypothetical protein
MITILTSFAVVPEPLYNLGQSSSASSTSSPAAADAKFPYFANGTWELPMR